MLNQKIAMNETNNKQLTGNAQNLRKNMTPEERHLWYDFLKNLPVTINKQKVIGRYIVDFYCAQAKIAVEVDGSQHYSSDGKAYDKERDEYLNRQGIRVLRYTNRDIDKNFDGVCADILANISAIVGADVGYRSKIITVSQAKPTPHLSAKPTPSPPGKGRSGGIQ